MTASSRPASWLLAALAGVACASDPPCGLRACDLREVGCQRLIAEATACLRGVPPVMVPVTVVAKDDYVANAATTVLTPEQEELFRRWNAGLAALGLAPANASSAETSAASAAQVGGSYSRASKQITVIDDGRPLDTWPFVALMVHEYTHAIQDSRFDLAQVFARHATDSDRALALGAVTEGEATYVGDLAAVGFFGLGPGDVPWGRVLDTWQESSRFEAHNSMFPVTLAWSHFRYPFGTEFTKRALDAGGWRAVDDIYALPPSGTREVIAGFGAEEPDGGPWVEDLGSDAVPILNAPFAYVAADRLGAWLFETFLGRLGHGYAYEYEVRNLPAQLRDDTLSIFRNQDTGGTAAVWRLRLATSVATFELETALGTLPAARLDLAGDRDLAVIVASDAATLDAVPVLLAYQAIPSLSPPAGASAAAALARQLADAGCVQPAP